MKLPIDKLIYSKDVLNHLKSINHQFTKLEEAFLIYNKDASSYKEKIQLFKEFISDEEETPLIVSIKKWISNNEAKLLWCLDPEKNPYPFGKIRYSEDVDYDIMDEDVVEYLEYNNEKYPELNYDGTDIIFSSFFDAIEGVKKIREDAGIESKEFIIYLRDWYYADNYDEEIDCKSSQTTKIYVDENYNITEIVLWDENEDEDEYGIKDIELSFLNSEHLNIPHPFKHGDVVKDFIGRYGVVDMHDYGKFSQTIEDERKHKKYSMTLIPVQIFDGVNMQYTMICPKCLSYVEDIPNDFKLLSKVLLGEYPVTFLINLIKGHIWMDISESVEESEDFEYGTAEDLNLEFIDLYSCVRIAEGMDNDYFNQLTEDDVVE